jgi:hypothetical protein
VNLARRTDDNRDLARIPGHRQVFTKCDLSRWFLTGVFEGMGVRDLNAPPLSIGFV